MLKTTRISFTIVMLVTLFACADKQNTEKSTESFGNNVDREMVGTQMQNPFEDFTSLKEAEQRAGFELKLPNNIPADYTATNYRVLINKSKLIEVIYKNGNKEICLRKGTLENISGVYTVFPRVKTIKLGNITVTLKGVADKIQLAEWKKNFFSFSINATEYDEKSFSIGGGVSEKQMLTMVEDMLVK